MTAAGERRSTWQRRPFSETFSVVSDGGLRVAQRDYLPEGALPVVDQGEGADSCFTNDMSLAYAGDLPVLVFGDHTRRVKLVTHPFAVGAQGVKLLRPRADVDVRFGYWSLRATRLGDRGYGRHFALLRAATFGVPPLAEQLRIVEILEAHLSHLDRALVEVQRATARSGLLWSACLRAEYLLAAQESRRVPLGQLCETSLGKMLDAKKNVGEQTPYLRNANVRWGSFDLTDLSSAPMTSVERDRLTLEPGDILVCEGGEPGRCAVWPGSTEPMTYQKALHRLRVRDVDALSPRFVALMLEQAVRGGRTAALTTGTTIKHLPQEKLRSLTLPVPPLVEQHAAVHRVAEISNSLQVLQRDLTLAAARESALRQALLEAAFSGRLTSTATTDKIEELASV